MHTLASGNAQIHVYVSEAAKIDQERRTVEALNKSKVTKATENR
jgi:hypothetical protein